MISAKEQVSLYEKLSWLRLARSKISPSVVAFLLDVYKDPVKVIDVIESRVISLNAGLRPVSLAVVAEEYDLIKNYGAELLVISDIRYPDLLRKIPFPPLVLTVKGYVAALRQKTFSVVGSRLVSFAAASSAYSVAFELGKSGYVLTSGMAKGIDAEVHRAALDADQATIGVLGTGINVRYPYANKALYDRMEEERGLLVSHFAFNAQPLRSCFPERNRLIAGISAGLLVAAARKSSGALITAGYAIDYGREVCALPGSIADVCFSGSNMLIKSGAVLVQSAKDIVAHMDSNIISRLDFVREDHEYMLDEYYTNDFNSQSFSQEKISELKDVLLQYLTDEYVNIRYIADCLKVDVVAVTMAVAELEILSKVRFDYITNCVALAVVTGR